VLTLPVNDGSPATPEVDGRLVEAYADAVDKGLAERLGACDGGIPRRVR